MINAGFQNDFNIFRVRGQIGSVLNIEVPSDRPEIGCTLPITFHTYGMPASASIDGLGRFAVSDGEVIRLRIREDRPYRIRLFVDVGAEAAALTLNPYVVVPEITKLTLPELTTYAESLLYATIATRNADEMSVLFRVEDEQDRRWHAAHVGQSGNFTIPILERPHNVFVRIELASRHAEYAARARRVIEQRVVIDHPEPHWWVSGNEPVYRFKTVQLPLHFRWVRSAQIYYNGHIVQAQLHDGVHYATVDVVTRDIGVQQILVNVIDLAGLERQITIPINVLPRRFAMSVVAQADSAIEITIEGGYQPRLTIPARSVEIELPDSGGLISHGFLLPTQALISVIDDQGVERQTQFLLAPPEHQWHQLPTLSQLNGWRM